jgi:hypothetical protein
MDVDAIIARANRIAEEGSAESDLFRHVLLATDGVAQVRQIVSKVPAGRVEEPSQPSSTEDEKSWVGLLLGAIGVALAVVCLISSAIMFKRSRGVEEAAPAGDAATAAITDCVKADAIPQPSDNMIAADDVEQGTTLAEAAVPEAAVPAPATAPPSADHDLEQGLTKVAPVAVASANLAAADNGSKTESAIDAEVLRLSAKDDLSKSKWIISL